MKRTLALSAAPVLLVAAVAMAAPASANTAASCRPAGAPSTLRLSVTKYPIAHHYEYHVDLNSSGTWLQNAIWIGTEKIGGTNDQFVDYLDGRTHVVKGQWFVNSADGVYKSCSVTL